MASGARHRSIFNVLFRVVIASALAVGLLAGLAPVRSVSAQPAAVLTLTKTTDNATINAGDPIGFTITTASTGNGNATSVFLTDFLGFLPSNPTWTETTGNTACSFDGPTLNCIFGMIPSGAPSITVHVTAPTTQQDCGTVTNTATILFGEEQSLTDDASVTIEGPTCPTPTPTEMPTETQTSTPTDTPTETPTNTPTAPRLTPRQYADGDGDQHTNRHADGTPTDTATPTIPPRHRHGDADHHPDRYPDEHADGHAH